MEKHEYDLMYRAEEAHWWFRAKRELIQRLCRDVSSGRILDVGCGTGKNLECFGAGYFSVGLDDSWDALLFCRRRGLRRLVLADSERAPFKNGVFTLLLALDVVEHVDNDRAVLRELNRIMHVQGRLMLMVPAHRLLWSPHDKILHHRRRYALGELEAKLKGSQLRIEKKGYFNSFLFPFILAWRIFNRLFGLSVKQSDQEFPLGFFNTFFLMLVRLEQALDRRIRLPIGVSLYTLVRK